MKENESWVSYSHVELDVLAFRLEKLEKLKGLRSLRKMFEHKFPLFHFSYNFHIKTRKSSS